MTHNICRRVLTSHLPPKAARVAPLRNFRKWAYWCDYRGIGEHNWMEAGWDSKPCSHFKTHQKELKKKRVQRANCHLGGSRTLSERSYDPEFKYFPGWEPGPGN